MPHSSDSSLNTDPWAALPPEERRFSVAEVRRSCQLLPPPRHVDIDPGVQVWRPAASVVPIVERDGEAAIVLTKRPATMALHGGDWVIPGGSVDAAHDQSPRDAARRETSEELGVPMGSVDIVGQLETYGPFITGFQIYVFVAIIDASVQLAPDENEVADAEVLPISLLMSQGRHYVSRDVPVTHAPGLSGSLTSPTLNAARQHGMHFFIVRESEVAWGLQGTILHGFLSHLVATRFG